MWWKARIYVINMNRYNFLKEKIKIVKYTVFKILSKYVFDSNIIDAR